MKNMNIDSSVERMKELINHGSKDAALKANVSETVEYKVNAPDGKTYGVVRERQKYFIKESTDGESFNYIGGIGNKNENEYPSYNSAYRNLELKIRSINESMDNGKVFEVLPSDTTSEYVVEATQEMRNEIDRQRQIMMNVAGILKEGKNEFINKPKFKDPEGFGTATDPKKQGEPFEKEAKATLDKDPNFKATDPKKQGGPFEKEAKSDEDKFDIEKTNTSPSKAGDPFTTDAKDVLGNSVATQKPKGGKVVKVTEAQLAEVKRRLSEMSMPGSSADKPVYPEDREFDSQSFYEPDFNPMDDFGDDDILGIYNKHSETGLMDEDSQDWDAYNMLSASQKNQNSPVAQKLMNKYPKLKSSLRKDDVHEAIVAEITEAVLNAFGKHPTYQKPAFTTPSNSDSLLDGTYEWDDESVKGDAPYGQKIGDSTPFTEPVKQKIGQGEIGEDADDVMKGKTQQGMPNLGQKGDKAPFDKAVQKNGNKIGKGDNVQQGETQQGKPSLGQKGDKAPFDKAPTKKAEVLNKIAESIIAELKKKH